MAPLVFESEIWYGTPNAPHTTEDIRRLKTALAEGLRVAFRRDKQAAWCRREPDERPRTSDDGVALSAISMGGEHCENAKQLDRDKELFLSETGGDHASLATSHSYQFPTAEGAAGSSAISKIGASGSAVSTRWGTALPYGRGVIAARALWVDLGNVAWLRRPVMIPIVIAIAVLSGLTPSLMAETFPPLCHIVASYVFQYAIHLS